MDPGLARSPARATPRDLLPAFPPNANPPQAPVTAAARGTETGRGGPKATPWVVWVLVWVYKVRFRIRGVASTVWFLDDLVMSFD